jgi:hypothetical protein
MNKNYTEREYISKKGINCLESSVFGRCKIISKQEVKEELEGNECFAKCDNIPESKYKFYVDEEIVKYYATLKAQ